LSSFLESPRFHPSFHRFNSYTFDCLPKGLLLYLASTINNLKPSLRKEKPMSLSRYGVLKGVARAARREEDEDTPHYQIHLVAEDAPDPNYRLAVNVKSKASPSELLFLVNDNFSHPLIARLPELPFTFTTLPSQPGGLALDFIRGNLFNRNEMRPLPFNLPGPDNDLSDRIEHYVARAIQETGAQVYAFGQRWGPEEHRPDKIFHFQPGNGVHDIHMNQGNVPPFVGDDGVWQDGALIIHLPLTHQWVAIFLAFQSQAWHTDDTTGHAITDIVQPGPGNQPDPSEPDHIVRIVGALVNPIGPAPERETVTLLNASPDLIDLSGWQIADKMKHKHTLSGKLAPGATVVVALPSTVQLGNKGGLITLLNNQGLKVDGVSYTAEQAQREGWTLVF
jgi:uncharacterized protein YukJ